jgi:putative membrane protein
MNFFVRIVVNALALWVLSYFNFQGIHADTWVAILVGGLVLGVANAIIKPILVVLSCPLVVLTLGLFTLIINGAIFYWVLNMVPGFFVPGFWPAFWGAIAMSIISWIVSLIFHDDKQSEQRAR